MKFLKPLVLLCFILLLFGCKKEYHTEFVVENESSRSLNIAFALPGNAGLQNNLISENNKLVLLVETGTGITTATYLNEITQLPFENVIINDLDGNPLTCDPQLFECWFKNVPAHKDGIGKLLLRINENSFQ